MKTLAALLIALTTLLSGCVVYDTHHYRDGYRGDRDWDGMHRGDRDRDRDRDGVPNWRDRRPDDPRRY